MVSRREKRRRTTKIPAWYQRRLMTSRGLGEYGVHLLFMLSKSWLSMIILGVFFGWRRTAGFPFGLLDGVICVMFVVPFALAALIMFGSNVETEVGNLAIRGRWDDVLVMLPKYHKKLAKAMGEPRAELATALWEGRARAKLEGREQALQRVNRAIAQDETPSADALLVLAQVLLELEEHEEAREVAQQIIDLDPDRIEGWVLVVELEAVDLMNPEAARIALDQARTLPKWADFGPTTDYVIGVTLAGEVQHEEAIELLEPFRDWADGFGDRLPLAHAAGAQAEAHIVCSLLALGRDDEAKQRLGSLRAKLEEAGFTAILTQIDRFIARHEPELIAQPA